MSDQNKDNQDEFEAIFPDNAHRDDAQSDASIRGEYTNDFDVVQSVEDVSEASDYQDSVTDDLEREPVSGEDYHSNSDSTSVIEDDLHDFSDIDDGVDEAGIFATPPDGRKKRKKSSSPALMAGVVLLAVGGAGGYFYYKNPEIVAQIQENFVADSGMSGALSNLNDMLGGAADAGSGVTVSPADVVSGDMPPQPAPYSEGQDMSSGSEASGVIGGVPVTPENQPPLGDVVMDLPHPVSDGADMAPPLPTPEADAPVVIGAMPADGMMQPAQPPVLDSMGNPIQNIPTGPNGPNGEMLPNVMGGEMPGQIPAGIPAGVPNENVNNNMVMAAPQDVPPQPDVVNEMPVVEDMPQVQENADLAPVQEEPAPVVEPTPEAVVDVAPNVPDMAPPVVQEEEVVVVDKTPEPVVEPVVAPVAQAEKVDPNKGNAKIFKPTETVKHKVRLVDDISQEKTPNETELADAAKADAGTDKKSEKDILHEELARDFFDAPPGKILDAMPAPAIDVKRGKTESIIVVHDAKSKGGLTKTSASSKSQPIQIETTSLDSKVIAADRALKLGRIDSAKAMFDELYALNPREPRVLMGRAIIFQKTGENARAISTYEELLAVSPNNAEAVINLAGLVRGDQPAVALSRLLELRQKYPDNPTIVAQLAISYADSGNLDDALRYLDKAIAMQPNNPQHYFNRAILSERAGKIPHAISFYEKALEVDAIQGGASGLPRDVIYDRLARLRVAQ